MSETLGAIVLAGGKSKRFGGDKRAAWLGGKPLIAHSIENAKRQASTVILSAGAPDNAPNPAMRDIPVVFDEQSGQGPLAGIAAGLSWFHENAPDVTRAAIFCADTPFLPDDYVVRLSTASADRIALAHYNGRAHYTCAGFPVSTYSALIDFLESGERRAEDFIRNFGFAAVDFSDLTEDPFFNINRPEDLEAAQKRLRGSS